MTPWERGSRRAKWSVQVLSVRREKADVPPKAAFWVELLCAVALAVAVWLTLARVASLSMLGLD